MTTATELGPFVGKMCHSTAKAVEKLKTGNQGDRINRDQMAAIIDRPCGNGQLGAGNVRSAINHVEKNYNITWEWSRADQAWICLNDPEKVTVTRSRIRKTRNAAKRAVQVARGVDVLQLDREQRREHTVNVTLAQMALTSSSGRFRSRVAKLEAPEQPPVGGLIELMKKRPSGQ
jgi:hypothetical protein